LYCFIWVSIFYAKRFSSFLPSCKGAHDFYNCTVPLGVTVPGFRFYNSTITEVHSFTGGRSKSRFAWKIETHIEQYNYRSLYFVSVTDFLIGVNFNILVRGRLFLPDSFISCKNTLNKPNFIDF